MVHRTDSASSVRGRVGYMGPGNTGVCHRVHGGAFREKVLRHNLRPFLISASTAAVSMTAVPHAISFEPLLNSSSP